MISSFTSPLWYTAWAGCHSAAVSCVHRTEVVQSVLLQDKAALSAPFAMSECYYKSHFLLEFTNKTLLLTLQRRGRKSLYSEGCDESGSAACWLGSS